MGDVLPLLLEPWDMVIGFPPCTHLAGSGAAHFKKKRADGRQQAAVDFFIKCYNANTERVCIENPVGIMSTIARKPDQIVQPWQFGDNAQKKTCLWLRGLPKLKPTKVVDPGEFYEWRCKKTGKMKKQPKWYADAFMNKNITAEERSKIRSKTFPGIAAAMADQWTENLM